MLRTFSPFLLFGFIFLGPLQSQTKQEILLRYKFVPGDTTKYRTVSRINQRGEFVQDMVITNEEISSYRTEKVYADTSADVIMTLENSTTHLFKDKVTSPREDLIDVPILLRRHSTGKVLDMKPVEDVSSKKRKFIEAYKTQMQLDNGFPDRPLQLEEQWERTTASSFDQGELRVELISKESMKWRGYDTFNGIRCAFMSVNVNITGTVTTQFEEVPVKGNGKGTLLFDPARGRIVQQWMEFQYSATIQHKKGPMELRTEVVQDFELIP